MGSMTTPFAKSYWVVEGRLLAGEYPRKKSEAGSPEKVRRLLAAGVEHVVDLTEAGELEPYSGLLAAEARAHGRDIVVTRVPMEDVQVPAERCVQRALDVIDCALGDGWTVYAHCWGGVGRTGVVVGAWLAERGFAGDAAQAEIARLRSGLPNSARVSPETPGQRELVRGWTPGDGRTAARAGERVAGRPSCPSRLQRVLGGILGGAVGDALGAPVEFLSWGEIQRQFGASGVTEYAPAYGRAGGAITDDTQMTMFTAEGLVRGLNRSIEKGICNPVSVVHHAYLRWLRTQRESSLHPLANESADGWLWHVVGLHSRRAPGNTCITALRAEEPGSVERRLNDSKGCGGGMRVAPVGLVLRGREAFELARDAAALTHSHPSGYLAAGAFAEIVGYVERGWSLRGAVGVTLRTLSEQPGHEETTAALLGALEMAGTRERPAEVIPRLGQGWIAEEALAIGVYCALVAQDFASGVRAAVNHGGDSDSTGAIAGHLLGLTYGVDGIPERWLDDLELRVELERLAVDLCRAFDPSAPREEAYRWSDYPGW